MLPGMDSGSDTDPMRPRDVSHAIWHGTPADVLAVWTTVMGLDVDDIARRMQAYNASVANDRFIVPYPDLETFVADPGIRTAIAAIYNNVQSKRIATYAEAATRITFTPQKPVERTMSEVYMCMTEELRRKKPR